MAKHLTLKQKEEIRQKKQNEPFLSLRDLALWASTTFKRPSVLSKSSVSAILKEPSVKDLRVNKKTRKNMRTVRFPALDAQLAEWVVQCEDSNVCLSGDMIKERGQEIAAALNITDTTALGFTNGWLHSFQTRHGFKSYRLHGESAAVDPGVVERGRRVLLAESLLYEPSDCFNMDECGLNYCMPPKRSIGSKRKKGGKPKSGLKSDKKRISIALATNADGTQKLPLFCIGHAQRPRCFGRRTAEEMRYYYRNNQKAWMTSSLFVEWLQRLNDHMRIDGRHILLLLDNASSHKVEERMMTNVRVAMLPPNTTSALQPLDAGVIATFKQRYKKFQLKHAIHAVATSGASNKPYAVHQLQAMEWCTSAWEEMPGSTIRNCWRHTGIVATKSLVAMFDDLHLESMGISRILHSFDI